MVLVSYDVNTEDKQGKRRLRKIAKVCESHGQRVQYSVFECVVEPSLWVSFREKLLELMDEEVDSLRFYFMGSNWVRRVEHHGDKAVPNLETDSLIL